MRRWSVLALSLWLPLLGLIVPLSAGDKKADKLPRTGKDDPKYAHFDTMMERFIADNEVPGAAIAVAKNGKLVYSRGFGFADRDAKTLVQPHSKFRIASISKPITAAAILRLIEMGKLKLDDHAFDLLKFAPPPMAEVDARLHKITIRELLQHTGGFDRDKSFDPMFRPNIIAKALGTKPPAGPDEVVRYMLGEKLDFDPGARYAYSNFGYCVLGRVIEKVTGKGYEAFVHDELLKPLKMNDTQLGKTLERAKGEVKYFDLKNRTGTAVVGPDRGKQVPWPYGAWYLEAMDAHGGWISSAPDLVHFAASLNDPKKCPILKAESIHTMFARPAGKAGENKKGKPADTYYGCGWQVRVVNAKTNAINTSHTGALDGTSTLLVRRWDGYDWAILFNARQNRKGEELAGLIDPLVHDAADAVLKK